ELPVNTTTAESDSKLVTDCAPRLDIRVKAELVKEIVLDTDIGSKYISNAAPNSRISSGPRLNLLSMNSKPGFKSDAKPAAAPVPTASVARSSPANALLPTVFEKMDFSLPATSLPDAASRLQGSAAPSRTQSVNATH